MRDSSSSYKIDYVIVIKTFLNPKGHQNPINGSKVTAILLNGWILPIGGASAVDGLRSTGLPHLVSVGIGSYSNGWKHHIASSCCQQSASTIAFDPITSS